MPGTPETDVVIDGAEGTEEVVEHQDELGDRVAELEASQGVVRLLQDPDIAAVIKAKQAGKSVTVSTEDPTPEPTLSDDVTDLTKDLDDDDPQKGSLDALAKLLDEKFSAQEARLVAVEDHAKAHARQGMKDEVAKARTTFSDFDEFGDDMMDLAGKFEGLSVQELYMLAKARSGKLDLAKPSTYSEKPTAQTSTRRTAPARRENVRRGKSGFKAMLKEALDKQPDDMFT